jgi:hypothetical protein
MEANPMMNTTKLLQLPKDKFLTALDEEAAKRKAKGDGRLAAIIERGKDQVVKEFPSTCKQALDPKNKVAKAEVDVMVLKLVGKRAEKFLKANP